MAPPSVKPFLIEGFTLVGVALLVVCLRTYVRISLVGFRYLEADDFLMLVAVVIFSAETTLAYIIGAKFYGLTNGDMTDVQRETLPLESEEYKLRVGGSKLEIAGWTIYVTVLWMIKTAVCIFYRRITYGLPSYQKRVYLGLGLVGTTYLTIFITILAGCHPIRRLWQINPNPGIFCHAARSPLIAWMITGLNFLTDVYVLLIPVPLFWGTSMSRPKKISLMFLYSGGVFVTVAGLLRMILIHFNPQTGPSQAADWAVRETFAALVFASLPMTWGWIQKHFGPIFEPVLTPLFNLNKRPRSDPQSGNVPLKNINPPNIYGAWGTMTGASFRTVVTHESQPDMPNRMFMHPGEKSTDEIMPAHLGGIQKDVEFSISTYRASVCNRMAEPVQDAGPAYPRGTLAA